MGETKNGKNGLAGTMRDLLQKRKDPVREALKVVACLRDDFPYVADLLGGLPESGDNRAISPGTITIFVHEGKARFSANVKSEELTFIGDVADIANPFGSINSALAMGDVSSKRYSGQANISKDDEKYVL